MEAPGSQPPLQDADTKTTTAQMQCPCITSHVGMKEEKNPWETCLEYAKGHVDGEIALWKDEVDKLLLFATFFAGVAGTFAVESYHTVRQDPTKTTALLLGTLITIQLNATTPQPNLPIDLDPMAPVTASARRINIYNFLSLILSLSVVMAGILCHQWLREYGQDPHGIPGPRHEHLGIRYMRSEGMRKWGVFRILKILPLILLLSLLLFFAGLIELLLGIDHAATVVASTVIGITTSFMLITTILPAFQSFWVYLFPNSSRLRFCEVPFKSPQAWICYRISATPGRVIKWAKARLLKESRTADPTVIDVFDLQTWSGFDWLVYNSHSRLPSPSANAGYGVHWLGQMYLQERELARALYKCIRDSSILESLRLIITQRDKRRASSIDEASRWSPSDVENPETETETATQTHLSDVVIFQTLAHLAEKIERGHPPTILFEERLDLYLKINEACPDPNIDCPLINDMDQKGLVPHETRKTLVQHITKVISEDLDINHSHLGALDHIVALEFESEAPDLQIFDDVLQALRGWIDRKEWNDDEESVQKNRATKSKLQTDTIALYNRTHVRRRLAAIRRSMKRNDSSG
ncbi:hypothetical protein NP233_g8571 [Leucocoprinus birnbaumii]|uniref:DUF6535 domain-containing protein n=1 Tax=Leucocoprinus birnbaumii TaxID=56174 RepID=A0AAD5VM26_9AGAR|nr:hypothetical protein NP233_g8571 [Leucocoprinus birnbaumii]